MICEEDGRNMLTPIPISTLGGWYQKAHRVLFDIAAPVFTRMDEDFWTIRSVMFRRHAALMVIYNAACLFTDQLVLVVVITPPTMSNLAE